MAFPIKDVRYTVRRSGAHLHRVYPRLLRDRSVMPSIDIAIQHFESMRGHERGELDPGVLAHFFADHKLARCIVACLGRSYRFRTRAIDELVTRAAARRLARRGLDSPKALRLLLYDTVNSTGAGYVSSRDRAALFASLEGKLALRRDELERLLYLDADEHAILERVAPVPAPADIVAQYNVRAIESLLRQSREVVLELGGPINGEAVLQPFRDADVEAEVAVVGRSCRLTARGRQDGLGSWTRHGRRLSRAVLRLLSGVRGSVVSASLALDLRGRDAAFLMDDDVLDMLAAPKGADQDAVHPPLPAATRISPAAVRRAQKFGASLVRAPELQIWSAGLLLPDFAIRRDRQTAFVVGVPSGRAAARLRPLAEHSVAAAQTIFVGEPADVAELHAVGGKTVAATLSDPDWPETAVEAALETAALARSAA